MKKTSKILSAVLMMVMIFAMATPAFAAHDTVDGYMGEVRNTGITLSNSPTAVGALYANGKFNRYVLIVPDGTIAYGNQSVYAAGRYYYTFWSTLPGSEVGGVNFPHWDSPTIEIENNLIYVLGVDLVWPDYADPGEAYVDPGFTIVSQTTANRYAAGESRYSETIVILDASGSISGTGTTNGVKNPAPGVSVLINDGSGEFLYTIKPGDTLSGLAAYFYGNADVYKLIYELNKDTIKNVNMIYAGQTIRLPSYPAVARGVARI